MAGRKDRRVRARLLSAGYLARLAHASLTRPVSHACLRASTARRRSVARSLDRLKNGVRGMDAGRAAIGQRHQKVEP
jgi:hypothetical protein